MNTKLVKPPREIIVFDYDEYPNLPISYLNYAFKNGYSVTEVNKEDKFVVMVKL